VPILLTSNSVEANNCLYNKTDNDRTKNQKQFSDDSAVSQLKTIAENNLIYYHFKNTGKHNSGRQDDDAMLRFIKILMNKINPTFVKIWLK